MTTFRMVFLAAMLLAAPAQADNGIITMPSNYSVDETISRFKTAVPEREGAGFVVFTEIDHAAAGQRPASRYARAR